MLPVYTGGVAPPGAFRLTQRRTPLPTSALFDIVRRGFT